MTYGICLTGVAPLRKLADHRSEMVSQLLFGEPYTVIYEEKGWKQVCLWHDRYTGWIAENQHYPISEQQATRLGNASPVLSGEIIGLAELGGESGSMLIPAGSLFSDHKNGHWQIDGFQVHYSGNLIDSFGDERDRLVQFGLMFLHTPYLWGGRSAFGIDCSGLTQTVCRLGGIQIPRDARDQAAEGEAVHWIQEALPGDLLFFDNAQGEIVHTGMLISERHILHAWNSVRIDLIDHQGIFNQSLRRYTHSLRMIRRVRPQGRNKLGPLQILSENT